jgi:hypothetical protein
VTVSFVDRWPERPAADLPLEGLTVVVGEVRAAPARALDVRAPLRDRVEFATVGGVTDEAGSVVAVSSGSVLVPAPPVSLPDSGTGVDITSPVRVTTTICTSSCVAPFAGIVNTLASSGVTERTN